MSPSPDSMGVDSGATVGSGVTVHESNIANAGLGLFAMRLFVKNAIITEYAGTNVSRQEAFKLPSYTHLASRNGTIIDGIRTPQNGVGGGSFANGAPLLKHSNAVLVDKDDKIFVKAIREIAIGQEIIVHYGRRGFVIACG